ncbi:MAG: vancomycin high temperature exclusion protein, partial [Ferruginibacter sp.]
IVLGAKVKENGELSNILKDRLQTALELYQMGKIKRFLLSGDHGRPTYDEVNAMKRYLQQHQVPDSVLFLDHAGFDTYSSMFRAKHIFQVTDAIVITQDFHLRRAVFTANRMGIDAIGFPADKRLYESRLYLRLREYMANVKAFYEFATAKKPAFEGAPIPITGDSRRTFD